MRFPPLVSRLVSPSCAWLLAVPLVVLSMNCKTSRESAMGEWPSAQPMDRMVEAGKVKGYVIPVGTPVPGKGAEMTVTLVDATVSGKNVVLATEVKKIDGGPPYAFSLATGGVKDDRAYQVWVEVTGTAWGGKKQKWGQLKAVPVVTGNTGNYVEIEVVPK